MFDRIPSPAIVTQSVLDAMTPRERRAYRLTPADQIPAIQSRIDRETARAAAAAPYTAIGGNAWASPDLSKARVYFNGSEEGYFDADTGALVSGIAGVSNEEFAQKIKARQVGHH